MHNINVNLSDSHDFYYTAYRYIFKSDISVLYSDEHREVREIGCPKTKHCKKTYHHKHKLNKTATSQEKQK